MDKLISFKTTLFFLLFISVPIRAQIGIGTDTPQRALEVTAPAGTPPIRLTNLTSDSANTTTTTKSVVVDVNGDIGVGRPLGSLLATIVSSRNTDLPVATNPAVTQISFDTDDLPATGTISRSGANFTVLAGGAGLYTFALQPQITMSTGMGFITFWAMKNGVTLPNTGVRNSSTGANDTQVIPLIITLSLVAGDVIRFDANCTVANGYFFDHTPAAAPVPSIPAVIIDVKGYNVF